METIYSIGIDIGTSTTQVIFSSLKVDNTASICMLPNFEITDKKVIYKSPIYFTPMKSDNLLDMEKISKLIEKEYQNAGLVPTQMATGAVIITGESANKENAERAAASLSAYAGEFVVAVAGADLEAILAGAGSGAKQLSEKTGQRIVNFDIGGGTVNAAVYEKGKLIDAYGIHIGGRLLRYDVNGIITYRSHKLEELFIEKNFELDANPIKLEKIRELCQYFSDILIRIVKQDVLTSGEKSLYIGHEAKPLEVDACTFSGGVGEYVYYDTELEFSEGSRFGDIGPFLGQVIRKDFDAHQIPILPIKERIRATVIGAGAHSMKLSGSTIKYDPKILPLKNIPIVCLELEENTGKICVEQMEQAIERYHGPVAFSMNLPKNIKYKELKEIAASIVAFYQDQSDPILLLLKEDLAKVLGQTIAVQRKSDQNLVCIDSVEATEGDYVDFCKPVGESMLVVVKTLLFQN